MTNHRWRVANTSFKEGVMRPNGAFHPCLFLPLYPKWKREPLTTLSVVVSQWVLPVSKRKWISRYAQNCAAGSHLQHQQKNESRTAAHIRPVACAARRFPDFCIFTLYFHPSKSTFCSTEENRRENESYIFCFYFYTHTVIIFYFLFFYFTFLFSSSHHNLII